MDKPIKSTPAGKPKETVYTIQHNGNDSRFILKTNSVEDIEILINYFIQNVKKNLVELTLRDWRIQEKPTDYINTIGKNDFLFSLVNFKDFIFHCGNHDLILRNPENNEMFVFDEHGIIFIYPEQEYDDLIKKLNIPFKADEQIVSVQDEAHYHFSSNGDEQLVSFINHFKLKKK